MTPRKLQSFAPSPATRGEIGERITMASSGATMVLQEDQPAYKEPTFAHRVARHYLGSVIYSAMLPLVPVDEYVFRRRYDADTARGYVYYIEESAPAVFELPSIMALWPHRQTFLFRSDVPSRRLPRRLPFIPSSVMIVDE